MGAIAGADFVTVEVLRPFGLIRCLVFFAIDIGSRRVQIAGISNQPSGAWMKQIARNLSDCFDEFIQNTRYLILNRDSPYTRDFRAMLAASGVAVLRLPSRSPNLNAFAERFVLSMKSERLDRVISLAERHLRHLLAEYVAHDHTERNHPSLGNELIEPIPANTDAGEGVVRRRARLEGLFSYYHRWAA
jgi:transposase InsO family protein